MKLLQLSYTSPNWSIKNLVLGQVNLIVGRNAVGKSRTLRIIHLLAAFITQKQHLDQESKWDILFENEKKERIKYRITSRENKKLFPFQANAIIDFEEISVNDVVVLQRSSKVEARIKSVLKKATETIYTPPNKLVLHTRRDTRDYPFLEDIITWAERAYSFDFGNISPYLENNVKLKSNVLTNIASIPLLFKGLDEQGQTTVIDACSAIGYEITNIILLHQEDTWLLSIEEKGLERALLHSDLSQGMYRALTMLILLEYLSKYAKTSTIVIDDFCEGLDYNRATKLGGIVFEKCNKHQIQLIVTSNDSFLMDVVDIKYWNVLERNGNVVSALNYQNSEALFKQFIFTGMSNFDFFASDYIKQKLK